MALERSEGRNVKESQDKAEREFQQWLKSLPKHSFVGFLTLSEPGDPRKAAYASALAEIDKTCDALLARNGLNPDKFREQFYRDVVKRLAECIIDRQNMSMETQDPAAGIYTGMQYSEEDTVVKPKKTRLRDRRSGKDRRKCVVFFEVERRKENRREGKERRGGVYAKRK
jgi:hypothetical protein